MGTTKFYTGFILVILTLGMLFFNSSLVIKTDSSLNKGNQFPNWRPDTQALTDAGCSSCHSNLNNAVGAGTIDISGITSIETLTGFNLQVKVTGFSQAQSDMIVMGLNEVDNFIMFLCIQKN